MRREHKLLTVLAASFLAMPAFGTTLAAPAAAPSTGLDEEVRKELLKLPYFGVFDNLEYSVDGSEVTLSGQVTRPVLKRDAVNVVKRLKGVEIVHDNVEVLPLSNYDDNLRVRAYYAIFGSPSLSRYAIAAQSPIRIVVKNGNVTLEGVVNSEVDRRLAFARVNGLPGTFSVTNNLRLDRED